MSSRGRKRQISMIDQENLDQALALMKSRKTGGTRTKYHHCAMILAYRRAIAALALDSHNSQYIADHDLTLKSIGSDIAALTAWIPDSVTVKTLNNYRSIDPLRYLPAWIRSMSKSQKKMLQDDLSAFKNYEEFKPERKKRMPTTLRGILAQQAKERGRG